MSNKTLISVLSAWILLTLLNYYIVPYFIIAFEWLLLLLVLLIWSIGLLAKLVEERKDLTSRKIFSALLIFSLFILTFYNQTVNKVIENIDWYIFYEKRLEVVQQVKDDELEPNVGWSNSLCELPFEFPVISNGGNDIVITKSDSTNHITVTFWVFRNFFSAPSTHFVYTNRPEDIKYIEGLIEWNPEENWQIEENWYRTCHD